MANETEIKGKGKRGDGRAKPRPLMFVFQVLDENGNPMPFPKERLNVLAATRDAGVALERMEGAENATYARVNVS